MRTKKEMFGRRTHERKCKKIKHMKELIKQYENNKKRSIEFMKNGQLNAYFEALLEMNRYKKLMLAVIAN